jgi:hypothetical protein
LRQRIEVPGKITILTFEDLRAAACELRMDSNDRVVVNGANKTRFLAIVSPEMLMVSNTGCELEFFSQLRSGQAAVKIDPLAAVAGPRFPPKYSANARGEESLLKRLQSKQKVSTDFADS